MGIDLGRFKSKKNDEWLDWLADDPIPAGIRARMRARAVQEASRPVVRRAGQPQPIQSTIEPQMKDKGGETRAISIHISVPKFKKPILPKKLPKGLTYKKLGFVAGAFIVVVVVGVIATQIHSSKGNESGQTGVLGAKDERPNFDYLLPNGKVSDTTGNTGSFNKESKTVSYADSIGGVKIVIHQTPLADELKNDTEAKVKEIAEKNAFSKTLATANPTAYLGTSARGQQTVMFSKKSLLVFIQSEEGIDEHDWAEYITNLK